MQIIDRRQSALGGQKDTRKRSAITHIAWHYSGVSRALKRFITDHESWWRSGRGWTRGGYHFYIDADGKIYQNYNYETVSNGVRNNNSYIVNICVEAGSGTDYSDEQIRAREWLTRKIMADLSIPASNVLGHKEFPKQTTACPGYSKAQMDEFRRRLATPVKGSEPTVSKEGNLYRVQVGAFSNKANAERLAKELKDKGYPVFIPDSNEVTVKEAPKPASKPKPQKSIDQLAQEVLAGKHGTGDARRRALGNQFSAVQARVNELVGANQPTPKKSVDEVAREIINGQGNWGNNPQRAERLRAAGYDPAEVQRRVNQLI